MINDDDFERIDQLFGHISVKTSLTQAEKVVLVLWHDPAIISNGGFQYYFETRLDGRELIDALETIGVNTAAQVVRSYLSKLNRIPEEERNSKAFRIFSTDEFDKAFWACHDELDTKLTAYVKSQAEFKAIFQDGGFGT